ncbi:MAG: YdcF family protein [Proteobacteria bacterium]|nr:YdcF family protein [Pseudomonadota bacterium]
MNKHIFKVLFLLIFIIIFIYFCTGLLKYKEEVQSLKEYSIKEAANFVILTGGSNRIKEGLKLIKGFSKLELMNIDILISGTGKGFTKSNISELLLKNDLLNMFIECCLELDSKSKNTRSNALETLKWVNKNSIKQLILITSNYHMPRAFLEFKNKMPNLKIIKYPITPEKHNINNWIYSYETFSLIFLEYCKFLIAHSRINISKILFFN